MSEDTKTFVLIIGLAVGLILMGFILGYIHVITSSKAYCVDYGKTIIMVVDGHTYRYLVHNDKFTVSTEVGGINNVEQVANHDQGRGN